MTALLLVAATIALAQPELQELPTDPFQRCAVKALRGDYGTLKPWQAKGYALGLERSVKANAKVWLTVYYGNRRHGQIDRRGRKCTMRTAAATSIAENAYVWCSPPGELRQILDTGSKRNDGRARRKGAERWVDFWYPSAQTSRVRGSAIARCAIIGRPEP